MNFWSRVLSQKFRFGHVFFIKEVFFKIDSTEHKMFSIGSYFGNGQ
jgi:hypothetical protein